MLATNRAWAEQVAESYLIPLARFREMTPSEICSEIRVCKRRRLERALEAAWHLSWSMAPHVGKRDRQKIGARRIARTFPGFAAAGGMDGEG